MVNDHRVFIFKLVVNGVREPFGQQPMEAKNLSMNHQRKEPANLCPKKVIEKNIPQDSHLAVRRNPTVRQII